MVVVSPLMPYPPASGGVKRTLRLLEAAERAGLTPHVLAGSPGDAGAADVLRARGWTVEVHPEAPPALVRRAAQHARRRPSPDRPGVRARLRKLAPEVAVVQFEHTQSAYYFAQARPAPVVFSAHNVDSAMHATLARAERRATPAWVRAWLRAVATRATERAALRAADAVLAVSPADAAVLGRHARRVVLAPNGVDDDFFAVPLVLPRANRVLFFGDYGYRPNAIGIERFVRSGWPAVRAAVPAATLRLVGQRLDERLREATRRPGVEPVGYVDDLRRELAAADVVVVCVWHGGGTRLKVLEAMAAARPVAGTPLAVSGVGFRDGTHGLVAEAPRDLGAAIARLLADPQAGGRAGAAARAHAVTHRWPKVLADAEALYRRYAERRDAP